MDGPTSAFVFPALPSLEPLPLSSHRASPGHRRTHLHYDRHTQDKGDLEEVGSLAEGPAVQMLLQARNFEDQKGEKKVVWTRHLRALIVVRLAKYCFNQLKFVVDCARLKTAFASRS